MQLKSFSEERTADSSLPTSFGFERPVEILLADDSPAELRSLQEALKEANGRTHFNVVWDGEVALTFLRQEGPYAGVARPDLILLDLNLPRKNGRAVLAAIKSDPELKHIPVVIFTTSEAEQDIRQAYELGANCYVRKPTSLDEFLHMMQTLMEFWLTYGRLPPAE
jgi:chemotaxis family two-component system response regulator Rcp1